MSEVRLVVRDAERSLYANRHGSFAEQVIAALSADPETIAELDTSIERFVRPVGRSYFHGFSEGMNGTKWDAGLVVIDLAARLIICDSSYSFPGHHEYLMYHDPDGTTVQLSYSLSDEWLITPDSFDWEVRADSRRRVRLAKPPLDVRAVLYGEPLLEFIARECYSIFRARPALPKEGYHDPRYQEEYDQVRDLHARWLMTPREELRGQTPRQIMLAAHEHLGSDYQDRKAQWSYLLRQPRPLERDSAAYRYGGLGAHELTVYYDLVRELLWTSRRSAPERAAEAIDKFVVGEVARLAAWRDEWLKLPYSDDGERSGQSIIESERLRIPELAWPGGFNVGEDRPLSELVDMEGPTFWNLCSCNMDDLFAFSFHHTQEEWDEERRRYEEFGRRCDAERAEEARLGVESPAADPSGRWRSDSIPIRLYNVGRELCKIIVQLRESTEEHDLIGRLDQAYAGLRDAAGSCGDELVEAYLEPALQNLSDVLAEVVAALPQAAGRCSGLHDRLVRFLEPIREPEDLGPLSDDDVPF